MEVRQLRADYSHPLGGVLIPARYVYVRSAANVDNKDGRS